LGGVGARGNKRDSYLLPKRKNLPGARAGTGTSPKGHHLGSPHKGRSTTFLREGGGEHIEIG